jgi:hypothetical protein
MKNILRLLILTICTISCNMRQTSHADNENLAKVGSSQRNFKAETIKQVSKGKKNDQMKLYPELEKRIGITESTPSGNYFKIILVTDSTCKVEWGNRLIKRKSSKDFYFSEATRLYFEWENKNFLVLRAGRGSDAWFDTFLPLDVTSTDFKVENVLTQNKKNNMIVAEYIGTDTIMFIRNLTNGKTQYVLEDKKCGSSFNHYCLDSIKLTNKGLYYRWILPHKIDDNKGASQKRVVIKI